MTADLHHVHQVVGTGMLVICILAVVDGRNIGAPRGMEPLAVGLILLGISVSMGLNCGYPLNPARDLGPRLFTAAAGWGMEVFRYQYVQKVLRHFTLVKIQVSSQIHT